MHRMSEHNTPGSERTPPYRKITASDSTPNLGVLSGVPGILLVAWLLAALLLAPMPVATTAQSSPAAQAPAMQVAEWTITTAREWQAGVVSGLIISNNAGGELRLQSEQSQGSFISRPFSTTFTLNAAGAFWRADLVPGTDIRLELRGRSTPPPPPSTDQPAADDGGWGPWQALIAGDARSQADDGAFAAPDVLAFPPETRYLQLRANLSSEVAQASPVLNGITIAYLNTMPGPPTSPGLPRSPIIFGRDTLTRRPDVVEYGTWSGSKRGSAPNRAIPRGIIIHQVDPYSIPGDVRALEDTLPFLRALGTYQSDVLGWDGMAYHYLIDAAGTLYEGRVGGPTSAVGRLSAGDEAVHIALIGDWDAAPSPAAQETLVNLLAWLGQAYSIPPQQQHRVLVGEELFERPNIVGHNQVAPQAPDPGEPLLALMEEVRNRTDQATIRSRWYFAEGNVSDYQERLLFFNPTDTEASATVTLLPVAGEVMSNTVTIPPSSRFDLLLNDLLPPTSSAPALVESSTPLVVERSLELPTDLQIGPGIRELSRLWYFAEGSTADTFETYLVLFNPHPTPTEATITYMKGDGTLAEQPVAVPPRQRIVITVGDVLPAVGFGVQVVASQSIAVERTMRFGLDQSGLHSGPGITSLSREWYFAEGTTDAPFQMRILLLNPNRQAATTTITFMTPDGTSLKRRYVIPATTRLVVDVNEIVPALGVATEIVSDRPIAAERALYFAPSEVVPGSASEVLTSTSVLTTINTIPPARNVPLAGSVSAGISHRAYTWYFADGRTINARAFLLLSNPGEGQASVTIDVILGDSVQTQEIVMPANSRYTLAIHDLYPGQPALSAIVRATQPIVAERSLFPLGEGVEGGTTAPGVPDVE
jgi:hypothetical protein